MHPVFYVSYLRAQVGPVPTLPPAPLPLDDATSGKHNLEDILYLCIGHSGTEYLMKCLCYPVFESTWELASHLANTMNIFR